MTVALNDLAAGHGLILGPGDGSRVVFPTGPKGPSAPLLYRYGAWDGQQRLYATARTNICLRNADFADALWSKGKITPAYTQLAPDGTNTAALITEDSTAGNHWIFQRPITRATSTAYSDSWLVKDNGVRYVTLTVFEGSTANLAYEVNFDLTLGVVTSVSKTAGAGDLPTWTIKPTKVAGWWQIELLMTTTTAGSNAYSMLILNRLNQSIANAANPSYQGDGTSGVYIARPMTVAGTDRGSTIPTVASPVTVTDLVLSAGKTQATLASAPAAGTTIYRRSLNEQGVMV